MIRRISAPLSRVVVSSRHFGFFDFLGKKEEKPKVEINVPSEPSPSATPSMPSIDTETIKQQMKVMQDNPDVLKKAMSSLDEIINGGGGVTGMLLRNGPLKAYMNQPGGMDQLKNMLKDPSTMERFSKVMSDPVQSKQFQSQVEAFHKSADTAGATATATSATPAATTAAAKPVTFSSRPQQKKK